VRLYVSFADVSTVYKVWNGPAFEKAPILFTPAHLMYMDGVSDEP